MTNGGVASVPHYFYFFILIPFFAVCYTSADGKDARFTIRRLLDRRQRHPSLCRLPADGKELCFFAVCQQTAKWPLPLSIQPDCWPSASRWQRLCRPRSMPLLSAMADDKEADSSSPWSMRFYYYTQQKCYAKCTLIQTMWYTIYRVWKKLQEFIVKWCKKKAICINN